ncbi:MAG: nuclear transport factor 2 family protein [Gemmatimonadetes bacterium]|nr:nuclear transport factor 2 family protein [Gemmatimonadota bacterium]
MRTFPRLVLSAILLLGAAAPVVAQQTDAIAAPPQAEEVAVRAVIDQLFDGMRQRDTTMIRSAFAPEAQFFGMGPGGTVLVNATSDFITSISQAPADMVLDEVLHEVEIRVDGPLAIAWTEYDFFAGEDFSHCGYNSFQLLKLRDEWKIVSVADSRRREGCRQQRS